MTDLTCFKAYDIRGRYGAELDATLGQRIGQAFVDVLQARRVVLGRDCRLSSPELASAVATGLMAAGAEVLDLGLCGTEEVYFATAHLNVDGGIMVTASHNPADDNGMKMVKAGAAPLDPATDLARIRQTVQTAPLVGGQSGRMIDIAETRTAYVDHILSLIDVAALPRLTILTNAGNGAAGPTLDRVIDGLHAAGAPLRFVRLHHNPDGTFPNGVPNPILLQNQPVTTDAVRSAGADLGLAWDGDFDRCFFFDANGRFVPGEYIVGLIAQAFLEKSPGEAIVHDPRVTLSITDTIERAGGRAVLTRTGHVFMKQAMRDHAAIYGGEMSAHHYFRDFYYCDSGMIPWLLMADLMGRQGASLADLIDAQMRRFPSSGEINFRPADPRTAIARVITEFAPKAIGRDDMDGISLRFPGWRMNLRQSNTEPLVRLNIEAEGDADLVARMTARISALLS